MDVEQRHQHQHQQQQQQHQQSQHQHAHQQQQQQPHHVHCSYENDIVCDEIQTHQQQQQQQQSQSQSQQLDEQRIHCHAHIAYSTDQLVSTPHRHQLQRKHSHSPHQSRHTSPHSHHSHSQHSSPHQSHYRVHEQHTNNDTPPVPPPRPSTQSSSSHAHHHHHHRRRRRYQNYQHDTSGGGGGGGDGGSAGGSGNSSTHVVGAHGHSHSHQEQPSSRHNNHSSACTRRHRSATDVSSTSINTCHDPTCVDREVQEILVHKSCCSNSRTELAQYFAEDLYGSSRRPSSCCTSSDYCYQTDSTSLYGSRSSLSRNNSIKSASVVLRKRRLTQHRPNYTSMSLRGLNASQPNSQLGSLTSIFDGDKRAQAGGSTHGSVKMIVSPSKVTIERHTSKDALSNDLPEYACSPSPIRWSFLADGKSPTEFEGAAGSDNKDTVSWKALDESTGEPKYEREPSHPHRPRATEHRAAIGSHSDWKSSYDERPSTSAAAARKCRDSPFSCDFEESTTVLFHQEGEAYNNCCNNYIQCNTYLDQDLQITSEDIQQYLSKGNRQMGDVLNNSKNYPFQPSNAFEFQYKNNFANNNSVATSSECGDSVRGGYDGRFRRNSSKETNLNQNSSGVAGGETSTYIATTASSSNSTPLSPTNINLSSSTNNINIIFNSCLERNANEVKFINTVRDNVVSTEAHHSGYVPYMYPTYDYTNMSANSVFDKPLGIDELPKEFATSNVGIGEVIYTNTTASVEQPPSMLHSPVLAGASFESFDAPSDHNLLSQRDSCQFSPTPRSPLSPASPASSCPSATINPAAASCMHTHHPHFDYQQQQSQSRTGHSPPATSQHRQPHGHHSQFHHHHFTESFKFSNAFKRVRRRARKYAEFLRKK